MEIINNDFDGYEEWLEKVNPFHKKNLNAELDAMALYFNQF